MLNVIPITSKTPKIVVFDCVLPIDRVAVEFQFGRCITITAILLCSNFLMLAYDLFDDLSASLAYLQSPVDGSGLVSPSLLWNHSDNITMVS